jgi:hypothetical protein
MHKSLHTSGVVVEVVVVVMVVGSEAMAQVEDSALLLF